MEERKAVERLKLGDVGGLELLVRGYHARAVRAAYLIVRDRAMAERPLADDSDQEQPKDGAYKTKMQRKVADQVSGSIARSRNAGRPESFSR